ncbi:unnamed protein product [Zymoseptoria tritici ST99CH_1A5]|uniref:Apple domain-containing protein n=1 Tax=Zymoseptoria tritici ST99CH_1A5 TaxID=1276529 RepID=A0A1Y6LIF7_ZYMTR|nr:unnamed protein product [Zymoseptoria tritici ST99CH_1A5]
MAPADFYRPENDAPEVVPPHGDHGPIHAPDYSQDPEVVKQTGAEYSPIPAHDHEHDEVAMGWFGCGASVLGVALGAGLGVSLNKSDKSSAPSTTTTPNVTATSSADTPPVTSGITGLAAFNCTASGPDVVFSHNNAAHKTECFKQYLAGSASVTRPNVTIVNLVERKITYTIEDCLDKCDKFDEPGQPPYLAVTYYANLTVRIEKFSRNCLLKNDRGGYSERQVEEVDLLHSMSAYRRCLNNNGCKGLL